MVFIGYSSIEFCVFGFLIPLSVGKQNQSSSEEATFGSIQEHPTDTQEAAGPSDGRILKVI